MQFATEPVILPSIFTFEITGGTVKSNFIFAGATKKLSEMTRSARTKHDKAYAATFPMLDARPPNVKRLADEAAMRARQVGKLETVAAPNPVTIAKKDTFGEAHYLVGDLAKTTRYCPNTVIRRADKFYEKNKWGVSWVGEKKKTRTISESAARLMFPDGACWSDSDEEDNNG
jgi:hypothetical protein